MPITIWPRRIEGRLEVIRTALHNACLPAISSGLEPPVCNCPKVPDAPDGLVAASLLDSVASTAGGLLSDFSGGFPAGIGGAEKTFGFVRMVFLTSAFICAEGDSVVGASNLITTKKMAVNTTAGIPYRIQSESLLKIEPSSLLGSPMMN